ncbi:MAG: hypothetical protein GX184_06605 [Clostridiaceae bacterium]|nr:hypothetical protein [Clostridiaceae bacterium]
MHDKVMYELTVFGGAGAAGVLMAFLYDLFRLKRRFIKTRPIVVHIEDVLYWVFAAIILFLSSYILNSGETRAYFFAGTVLGALTYLGLFSKPVIWLLTLLIKIILWPLQVIINFLRPVVKVLISKMNKTMGRARKRVALEQFRMRVKYMRLRNAFTKK